MLCQTPHADNAEEKQIKAVRRKKRAAESQGEATDGDGNIDLDEFRAMIRTSRQVSCRLHALPVAII